MAFSKLTIGSSFTHNGNVYVKLCPVSAESQYSLQLFGGDEFVKVIR